MDISDLELSDRYETLLKEYVKLAPEVAKVLEKFGRFRNELQSVAVEMEKRKLKEPDAPKDSDS